MRNAVAWPDFVGSQDRALQFEMLPFDHPLYIMYSSGTTGVPKCIVHGAGGTLIQHLKELVLHTDLKREDRLFYYTTCGWMMWNWFVSASRSARRWCSTTARPSHPDGNALWDLVDEVGISVFGTSAKWISAIEKAGVKPRETHKLLTLKTILSTGSPLAPESFDYVYRDVKERVLLSSISGGTDIISCFALGNPLLPVYRGELQCRGLGMKVEILDEQGNSVSRGKRRTRLHRAVSVDAGVLLERCRWRKVQKAYFSHSSERLVPRRSRAADRARRRRHLRPLGRDAESRRRAHRHGGDLPPGRADRRKSSNRSRSASTGTGDERVILFVRLREGVALDDALRERIRKRIRDNTTPRHVPAKILQIADIPRTISGKITEIAVRDTIHGLPVKNTDALANPQALALYRELPELSQA